MRGNLLLFVTLQWMGPHWWCKKLKVISDRWKSTFTKEYRYMRIDELHKEVGMVFKNPIHFKIQFLKMSHMVWGVNGIDHKTHWRKVEHRWKQAALWEEVKDKLKIVFELSGGQQQRLCIARAAIEPSVLLMDEPASALDPISTSKIEELIYELKSKYTIIIVTHNVQQAGHCEW